MKMQQVKFMSHTLGQRLDLRPMTLSHSPKLRANFALISNFEWKLVEWFNVSQNCLLLIWSDPFLINHAECGGEREPDVILIFISSSVNHIWIKLN